MPDQSATAPYSTAFSNIAALEQHLGQELGISPWISIDQSRIDQFAAATEDHQWIHTNPQQAATHSPFGSTIAHGFLILSLASKFVYDCYQVASVKMGVNYGLDRVRFINPVRVNTELRGRVRLLSLETGPQGTKIKMEITFEIKGEEKPACVAEFIGMLFE